MIPMRGAGRDYQLTEQHRDNDMTEGQADAVRLSVIVARQKQIKTGKALINELCRNHSVAQEDAEFALRSWQAQHM